MHEFAFKARNPRNKVLHGSVYAETEQEARQQLEQRAYEVLRLRRRVAWGDRIDGWINVVRPPSRLEIAHSTGQLALMLNSGISMGRCLTILSRLPLPRRLSAAWKDVALRVNRGESLSRALANHGDLFTFLYVNMVKVGETSGQLAANLQAMADHLEREVLLMNRMRAAMAYPALVFVSGLGLSFLFVQHILPQFINGIFTQSGLVLPWPTRLLIAITNLLNQPFVLAGGALALTAGIVVLRAWGRTPTGRFAFQKILLGLPRVRDLVARSLAVRFCSTMAALLQSNVSVTHSLELANLVLGNRALGAYLDRLKARVKDGGRMSDGIREVPFFPPLTAALVFCGEETGDLPQMFHRLSRNFQEELELALEAFNAWLQPVLIAVSGLLVAFILLAIAMPLQQLMQAL